MKQYYNKMCCNASFILRIMKCDNDVYRFHLDDGQEYEAYNGTESSEKVRLISSPTLYAITHRERGNAIPKVEELEKWFDGGKTIEEVENFIESMNQTIEINKNEWIVPSVPVFLVERYDMNDDEMRVAVVEEKTFQSNFYPDEPSNLIEMYSVEKSNHQYRS